MIGALTPRNRWRIASGAKKIIIFSTLGVRHRHAGHCVSSPDVNAPLGESGFLTGLRSRRRDAEITIAMDLRVQSATPGRATMVMIMFCGCFSLGRPRWAALLAAAFDFRNSAGARCFSSAGSAPLLLVPILALAAGRNPCASLALNRGAPMRRRCRTARSHQSEGPRFAPADAVRGA